MKRRGHDGPPRLLVLDKPVGPTSFDMVRDIRRLSGYRKVGHAGTLDPFASGVLVLGLGSATRLLRFAADGDKIYRLTVEFGRATDSHDCTGETVAEAPVDLHGEDLARALPEFTGTISQRPPRLSAVHVEGERAYRLERRGELKDEPEAREVRIESIDLLHFEPPRAELRVRCGGGTYMRSLARDLGERMGCPAHAAALVRESVGEFALAQAHGLEELRACEDWDAVSLGPEVLFEGLPRILMSGEDCAAVRQGRQPTEEWLRAGAGDLSAGRVVLLDGRGRLVSLAELLGGAWRLAFVLREEADAGH